VLQQLLDGVQPPLALVPMTTDGDAARVWLTEHLDAGIEGVVAKRLDHAYSPGKRAWSKIRGRVSAEAVVGEVLGPIGSGVALVLGRRRPPAGGWPHQHHPARCAGRARGAAAAGRSVAPLAVDARAVQVRRCRPGGISTAAAGL
jgi:hypothetical protein